VKKLKTNTPNQTPELANIEFYIEDLNKRFEQWGQENTVAETKKTYEFMKTIIKDSELEQKIKDLEESADSSPTDKLRILDLLSKIRLLRDKIAGRLAVINEHLITLVDPSQLVSKVIALYVITKDLADVLKEDLYPDTTEKDLPYEIPALKQKTSVLQQFTELNQADYSYPDTMPASSSRYIRNRICIGAELNFGRIFTKLKKKCYERYHIEIEKLEKECDKVSEYLQNLDKLPDDLASKQKKDEQTASGGKAGDNIQATLKTAKPKVDSIRNQVFICYSHKDERWFNDLRTHLTPYVRNESVTAWSDKQIAPGSKWFKEIEAALAAANVAVLLSTPAFLASDFIHKHELGPLLQKAENGKVNILWIPVRACAYKETPLKDYQAAGNPDKPLANMKANRDKTWVRICEEIKKLANI